MKKLMLIMVVILLAKIQTFACEWSSLQPSFYTEFSKFSSEKCKLMDVKVEKKSAQILCDAKKSYSVSFENASIYFLTHTATKYPYLSQCWIEGSYDQSCRVQLKPQHCQTWDLRL